MDKIPLADIHAIEESIRFVTEHPNAGYDDLIGHLDWYWQNNQERRHPKEWVLDWIKCLVGEYDYEDFTFRRSLRSNRGGGMDSPRT